MSPDSEWSQIVARFRGRVHLHEYASPSGEVETIPQLELPNGDGFRRMSVTSELLELLESLPRGPLIALGNYDAWLMPSGVIEASLDSGLGQKLARMPGSQSLTQEEIHERGLTVSFVEGRFQKSPEPSVVDLVEAPEGWEVSLTSDVVNDALRILTFKAYVKNSIRIKGPFDKDHDSALRCLEQLTDSIFFELDYAYGVSCRLRLANPHRPRRSLPENQESPRFPTVLYRSEPMQLYRHGRAAMATPLVEYLAYYQVVEYHFPLYFEREQIDRLRRELRDPLFRTGDDEKLARVVRMLGVTGGLRGSELDQLKATLKFSLSDEDLRTFIQEREERANALSNKSLLRGVNSLSMRDPNASLLAVVAQRIYKIRCRIVHSKAGEEKEQSPLILPLSEEARLLRHDIDLVRFVAERVLIASSSDLVI